jgi:hypothetical protein
MPPPIGDCAGAGVYFTPDKQIASTIAKHRGLQFVVECEVTISKTFDFDSGSADLAKRSKTWAHQGYDSAKAMHGAWAGVTVPFREFCVHDAAAVRVIKVEGFVAAPK